MDEGLVQALAEGGGAGAIGLAAYFLSRIVSIAKDGTEHLREWVADQRRLAARAAQHYDVEEDLYAGVREANARHAAAVEARAENEREMIKLRAEVDSLRRRQDDNTDRIAVHMASDPSHEDSAG